MFLGSWALVEFSLRKGSFWCHVSFSCSSMDSGWLTSPSNDSYSSPGSLSICCRWPQGSRLFVWTPFYSPDLKVTPHLPYQRSSVVQIGATAWSALWVTWKPQTKKLKPNMEPAMKTSNTPGCPWASQVPSQCNYGHFLRLARNP